MMRKIKWFFATFFCLNFFFPIKMSYFPLSSHIFLIPAVFLWAFCIFSNKFNFPYLRHIFRRQQKVFFLSFVFIFLFAFLSLFLNQASEDSIFFILINYLLTYLLSFILADFVFKFNSVNHENFRNVFNIVIISGVVVSISVLLEVFVPGVKNILVSNFYKSSNIDFIDGYRASGFVSSGGAAQSFGMCICVAVSLLMARDSKLVKNFLLYFLSAFVIFAGTFFVGRSGFILSLLFFFIFSLEVVAYENARIKTIFFILLALLFLIIPYTGNLLNEDSFKFFVSYSFELLNNYLSSGSLQTKSTIHLESMYYLPSTFHFLFGAGFYSNALYGYKLPDPGVMKTMLSLGLFGATIFYINSLVILCLFSKNLFNVFSFKSIIPIAISVSFMAYEFKEPGLYQNYAFRIMIFIYFFSAILISSKR